MWAKSPGSKIIIFVNLVNLWDQNSDLMDLIGRFKYWNNFSPIRSRRFEFMLKISYSLGSILFILTVSWTYFFVEPIVGKATNLWYSKSRVQHETILNADIESVGIILFWTLEILFWGFYIHILWVAKWLLRFIIIEHIYVITETLDKVSGDKYNHVSYLWDNCRAESKLVFREENS